MLLLILLEDLLVIFVGILGSKSVQSGCLLQVTLSNLLRAGIKRILPPPLSLSVPVNRLTLLKQKSGSYTHSLLTGMVDNDG